MFSTAGATAEKNSASRSTKKNSANDTKDEDPSDVWIFCPHDYSYSRSYHRPKADKRKRKKNEASATAACRGLNEWIGFMPMKKNPWQSEDCMETKDRLKPSLYQEE